MSSYFEAALKTKEIIVTFPHRKKCMLLFAILGIACVKLRIIMIGNL